MDDHISPHLIGAASLLDTLTNGTLDLYATLVRYPEPSM